MNYCWLICPGVGNMGPSQSSHFPMGGIPASHPQQLQTQPTTAGSLLSSCLTLLWRVSGQSFKSCVHKHGMQQLFSTYGDPSSGGPLQRNLPGDGNNQRSSWEKYAGAADGAYLLPENNFQLSVPLAELFWLYPGLHCPLATLATPGQHSAMSCT